MVVFLSQLNDLEIWGADVENAYLEAYTDEKLCIIAGNLLNPSILEWFP